MASDLQDLIAGWDGFAVVARRDSETGAWLFISLHDTTLGPCSGGTRMKVYSSPAEGLHDGMRLAEGMTQKWATIGLPYGGGKAVIALEGDLPEASRRGLLLRYGELVESLGGVFQTGEDLGTTTEDMVVIAERTRFVHGFDAAGTKLDPSPYTARGVYAGLRAALEHVFGDPDPRGRTVVVEGVGNVGARLARELATAGARLLLSDLDEARATRLAAELSAETLPPAEVASTSCDVYAPCAVGGTLNRETIPALACRIVAGSANNQLAERADAERLVERGITYAPDFIINGGGALAFGLLRLDGEDPEALYARVEDIGTTIREVLGEADAAGGSSVAAAEKRVARTLAAARATG